MVRMEFGVFAASLVISTVLHGCGTPEPGSGGKTGAAPGVFDYFIMAFEFQPQWSKGECDALYTMHLGQHSYAHSHMSIHGMWPGYDSALNNGYDWPQYCGDFAICAPDQSDLTDPSCYVTDSVWAYFNSTFHWQMYALQYAWSQSSANPSDTLALHEWAKHGTCTGLSQQSFFQVIEQTMMPLTSNSNFSSFIKANLGTDVSYDDLLDAFNLDFTPGSVVLRCDNCEFSEAWIQVDVMKDTDNPALLLPNVSAPQNNSDTDSCKACGSVHINDWSYTKNCGGPSNGPSVDDLLDEIFHDSLDGDLMA